MPNFISFSLKKDTQPLFWYVPKAKKPAIKNIIEFNEGPFNKAAITANNPLYASGTESRRMKDS
ncbi:hypothetical protein FACS189491_07700 [Spirochaetia bacterium]|nr:hypothetical protein FACS189491_07700 [Spirochaetia bacterium]